MRHFSPLFLLLTTCTNEQACESPEEDTGIQIGDINETCLCQEPSIAIGTGRENFEPISNGDNIEMTFGPQGGWHIWGSIQATNTRNVIRIHFEAIDIESGETVVDVTHQVALAMENDCTGSYTGMYGFLKLEALYSGELDTPPELICGHLLEVRMTVSDSGGRLITETVETVTTPDPADVENCIQ
jgi:hypothetical protein